MIATTSPRQGGRPAYPCNKITFADPASANEARRQLMRSRIPTHVQYCEECDAYHTSVQENMLPERDIRIILCIAEGYTYPEVASILGISKARVNKSLSQLFARFYATNAAQLVAIAISLGLIDVRPTIPALKERNHA